MNVRGGIVIAAIYLICNTNLLSSQITVLRTPQKYKAPTEKTDINKIDVGFINEPWVVFSDRDNNNTSTVRNGSADFKALKYMEPFYVIEEHQDKIHIIKASEGSNYDRASMKFTNYEDYGWVEKSKMLLWRSCMVTETSRLTRKAMVVNSLEWAKRDQRGDQIDILKFAKNPSLQSVTDEKSQLSQIFYIYKFSNDGKSLLLGKSSRIYDARQPESDIVGWAPRERLIYWDHRVALEPNWMDDAVRERRSKGIKATIFRDATEAAKFNQNRSYDKNNVLWDDDPYQARRIGDYKRFPYLSVDTNNIVKCILFLPQQRFMNQQLSEAVQKIRNVNIIIIVDGNVYMKEYFSSVAEAITSFMKKRDTTNTRIGVVVFGLERNGEHLTKQYFLSKDLNSATNWLRSQEKKIKGKETNDLAVSTFLGLNKAVHDPGIKDDETNHLVLISNATKFKLADDKKILNEFISSSMAYSNVHFWAFQVENTGSLTKSNYEDVMTDLIRITSIKVRGKSEEVWKLFGVDYVPKLMSTGNSVEIHYSPVMGKIIQGSEDSGISRDELKSKLDGFFSRVEENLQEQLRAIAIINEGNGMNGIAGSLKPALINILFNSGLTIESLKLLSTQRNLKYTTGFSSIQPDGLKHPLFLPVLFITRLELGQIVGDISRLLNTPTGVGARRQLYNNWLRLLEEHTGENYSSNTDIKMEDVTELLWGLPSTSRFLKDIRLGDIIDPGKFSDNELTDWMDEMDGKLKLLRRIQNDDNYQYSFKSNDEAFYWIGQVSLP